MPKGIAAKCSRCGGKLAISDEKTTYGADKIVTYTVIPCSYCNDKKFEEGKERGKAELRIQLKQQQGEPLSKIEEFVSKSKGFGDEDCGQVEGTMVEEDQ